MKPSTTIVLLTLMFVGKVAVAKTVSLLVTELPLGYAVMCGTIVWVMVAAVCALCQSQIMTLPAANSQTLSPPVGNGGIDVIVADDEFANAA